MPKSLLTLGSFSFEGLESPQCIQVSSKQRIAIHHLGSGLSIADSLGQDNEDVTFGGIFSGVNAEARIRVLEYMKSQGSPVLLTWGSNSLSVIIQKLQLNYSSSQWVPYKLCCCVSYPIQQYETSESADTEVGEMISLTGGTGFSPTSTQIAAILNLASMNYDIAPADELNQAEALANSIDSQIDSLSNVTSEDAVIIMSSSSPASQIASIIADSGIVVSLILARNRLSAITVRAENAGQQ